MWRIPAISQSVSPIGFEAHECQKVVRNDARTVTRFSFKNQQKRLENCGSERLAYGSRDQLSAEGVTSGQWRPQEINPVFDIKPPLKITTVTPER
jgi:hypothetical protein